MFICFDCNIYFSKSLASMRQKLRKYLKDFEEDIAKFRENPEQPDDEEEEEKRRFSYIIIN